jgi:hypothetical protein
MKCDLCGEELYKSKNMKTGEMGFSCLNLQCKLSPLYCKDERLKDVNNPDECSFDQSHDY